MRRTRLIREVERRTGLPIKAAVRRTVQELGVAKGAQALGISKATLSYWLVALGLRVERVVLDVGEDVRIVRRGSRADGSEGDDDGPRLADRLRDLEERLERLEGVRD